MTVNTSTKNSSPRVMWLLNHSAARRFEVAMFKKIGINEIFLPKSFPDHPSFRSASVDFSEDKNLSIPPEDLQILNETDWYGTPSKKVWDIANRYFDILFFLLLDVDCFSNMVKNFKGSVVYRAYGVIKETVSYSNVMKIVTYGKGEYLAKQMGNRFWYGHAYEHQFTPEKGVLLDRSIYLPLGLLDTSIEAKWTGSDKRIFFVCPDIGLNHYYRQIYDQFIKDFKGFPYVIAGTQSLKVSDPNVLGFVSKEEHEENMRTKRVMFYHSDEPYHVHYHPFEAIRVGMPLVYMADGLLDYIGGANLPGRCTSISEAREKITRILNDDWDLINKIVASQAVLLEQMTMDYCEPFWEKGLKVICDSLNKNKLITVKKAQIKPTRIAVIAPTRYRGGSLRGAKLLAQALHIGAQQAGKNVEIVFAHLDDDLIYPDEEEFNDLPSGIKRRPYRWKLLNDKQAYCALACAGMKQELTYPTYCVPDDGIQQFMDCDMWVFVSDRFEYPLLPIRPYILMVYDYLQRYQPIIGQSLNHQFIAAAYEAQSVWVTTEFTKRDALHYTGLMPNKVHKLPMLAPQFAKESISSFVHEEAYFIWTTNLGMHKNQANALKALQIYYQELSGQLICYITGVNTQNLFKNDLPHLQPLQEILSSNPLLNEKVRVKGEIPNTEYQHLLAGARFLWHPGKIDNGTFSVIEAAHFGVPALSSDYPAMQEINMQFNLNLSWMNADDPKHMAYQLKQMEEEVSQKQSQLPTPAQLAKQSVEHLAHNYWAALEDCL